LHQRAALLGSASGPVKPEATDIRSFSHCSDLQSNDGIRWLPRTSPRCDWKSSKLSR